MERLRNVRPWIRSHVQADRQDEHPVAGHHAGPLMKTEGVPTLAFCSSPPSAMSRSLTTYPASSRIPLGLATTGDAESGNDRFRADGGHSAWSSLCKPGRCPELNRQSCWEGWRRRYAEGRQAFRLPLSFPIQLCDADSCGPMRGKQAGPILLKLRAQALGLLNREHRTPTRALAVMSHLAHWSTDRRLNPCTVAKITKM
jgi:hypothetical protein